jgi:hypothetical protein
MTSLLLMRPETGPESINDFMVRSTQGKCLSHYKHACAKRLGQSIDIPLICIPLDYFSTSALVQTADKLDRRDRRDLPKDFGLADHNVRLNDSHYRHYAPVSGTLSIS